MIATVSGAPKSAGAEESAHLAGVLELVMDSPNACIAANE